VSNNKGKGMWPAALGVFLVLVALIWVGRDIAAAVPGLKPAAAVVPWLAGLVLVVLVLAVLYRAWHRRTPRGMLTRREERARRHRGLAPWWRIVRQSGRWTVWKRFGVIREDLMADARLWGIWRRFRWAPQAAYRVVRVGLVHIWLLWENSSLRIAPPGGGKTAELIGWVVAAPGAAVVTSTKVDLLAYTLRIRREHGPVLVFNPGGLGGARFASNFGWDPLIECEDPKEARRRAGHLLSGSPGIGGIASRDFWESQGVRVLTALLHAAALGGKTMLDVQAWVSQPQDYADVVLDLLAESPMARPMLNNYQHFLQTNHNTSSSTTTTIQPALEWLQDPSLAEVAVGRDRPQLDAGDFIARHGTLYLLTDDEDAGTTAPLFTALTSWLHRKARKYGTDRHGLGTKLGRLRVPMTLVLDEVANICPVPLHRWTGDSRGSNISIHIALQNRAQLTAKWGREGAEVIWGNIPCKIFYGGIDSETDLESISKLCGEYDEKIHTENTGPDGRKSVQTITRTVRVIPPAAIRTLPDWHALVIRGGMEPTIGRFTPGWDLKPVKRAGKAERREARAAREQANAAAAESGPAAPVPPRRPAEEPAAAGWQEQAPGDQQSTGRW
jgi:type IV secretion system protein VirD4